MEALKIIGALTMKTKVKKKDADKDGANLLSVDIENSETLKGNKLNRRI